MRWLVVLMALALTLSAHARMYQWVSPRSGTTQMSNTPPAWYRNGDAEAPRVLVFENGRLLDDTSIAMPNDRNQKLRQDAFAAADAEREAEALKRLEQAALREAARRDQMAAAERLAERAVEEPPPEEVVDQSTIDQLKALIEAWDRSNPEESDVPQVTTPDGTTFMGTPGRPGRVFVP